MKKRPILKKIEEILSEGRIELVSFGLAPNPNGFCFESDENVTDKEKETLSLLLDGLTRDEETYLRTFYL